MKYWNLWQIIRIEWANIQSRSRSTHKLKISCSWPVSPIQVNPTIYFFCSYFKYYGKMSQTKLIIVVWQPNLSSTGEPLKLLKNPLIYQCIWPQVPHWVCSKLFLLLPSLTHFSYSSEDTLLSKFTEEKNSNRNPPLLHCSCLPLSPLTGGGRWEDPRFQPHCLL